MNRSCVGSQVFFWWHCDLELNVYSVIVKKCFAFFALWQRSTRNASCLAMTANMFRDLSALCKHGFVRSELCASWLLASSLKPHANDSYANEHHSELLAAAGAAVISPIHFDLLAFPTLGPALFPLASLWSRSLISVCLWVWRVAAAQQWINIHRLKMNWAFQKKPEKLNDLIFKSN